MQLISTFHGPTVFYINIKKTFMLKWFQLMEKIMKIMGVYNFEIPIVFFSYKTFFSLVSTDVSTYQWCSFRLCSLCSFGSLFQRLFSCHWYEWRHTYGEVLVFYLPIRFFYYLANLIIFTRSNRIHCILFLEGGFKGIYLREKNFTLSYVVSEI